MIFTANIEIFHDFCENFVVKNLQLAYDLHTYITRILYIKITSHLVGSTINANEYSRYIHFLLSDFFPEIIWI